MKVRDVFRGEHLDIVGADPTVLLIGTLVAQPFHTIAEFDTAPPVDLRVEYGFDLVLDFAIDFNGGRR